MLQSKHSSSKNKKDHPGGQIEALQIGIAEGMLQLLQQKLRGYKQVSMFLQPLCLTIQGNIPMLEAGEGYPYFSQSLVAGKMKKALGQAGSPIFQITQEHSLYFVIFF